MPVYEYKCLKCGKETTVYLSLKERETTKVTCSSCKSTRMEQQFTVVTAKTDKKS